MADSRIVGDNRPNRNTIRRNGREIKKEEKREKIAKLSCSPSLYDPFFEILDPKSLSSLALTCRFWYQQTEPRFSLPRLLQLAFNNYRKGLINRSERMPDFSNLILQQTQGKEPNGREWKAVSVIEYLTWSGNISMLNLLIEKMSPKHQAEALSQITNVKENGTEHGAVLLPLKELNGAYEKRHEAALENCSTNDNCIYRIHFATVRTLASKQKRLPLNLLPWYFGEEKLDPIPDFTQDPTLSLELAKDFSDYLGKWNNADNVYVIQRDNMDTPSRHEISKTVLHGTSVLVPGFYDQDWAAMKALYEIKMKQINELIKKLSFSLSPYDPLFETLDPKDLFNLGLTCRLWYRETEPRFCLPRLLQLAFNNYPKGFINRSKTMPDFGNLILQQTQGKEPNGREWKAVSVIEYLAWSGNINMLNLLIEKMSPEQQEEALSQITNVKENGTEHGEMLLPLVELNIRYHKRNGLSKSGYYPDQMLSAILGTIDNLANFQRALPLNLLAWYFGTEKLIPVPDFTKDPIPDEEASAVFSRYIQSWKKPELVIIQREWLSQPELLPITKKGHLHALETFALNKDWDAMQALYKTKIEQINELIDSLSKQLNQKLAAFRK